MQYLWSWWGDTEITSEHDPIATTVSVLMRKDLVTKEIKNTVGGTPTSQPVRARLDPERRDMKRQLHEEMMEVMWVKCLRYDADGGIAENESVARLWNLLREDVDIITLCDYAITAKMHLRQGGFVEILSLVRDLIDEVQDREGAKLSWHRHAIIDTLEAMVNEDR